MLKHWLIPVRKLLYYLGTSLLCVIRMSLHAGQRHPNDTQKRHRHGPANQHNYTEERVFSDIINEASTN